MIKAALSLFFIAFSLVSFAQLSIDLVELKEMDAKASPQHIIDYLIPKIDALKNDSDSIKAVSYFYLGRAYGAIYENDSAVLFIEKSIELSEKHGYRFLLSNAYNSYGNISRSLSENDQAMKYFNRALGLLEGLDGRETSLLKSIITGNIGGIYYDLEQYTKALEYARASFEIIKTNELTERYFIGNLMMAFSHRALGNLDEALAFNEQVLAELLRSGDSSYLPHTYYNIASIYRQKELWTSAIDYFSQAEGVALKIKEWEVYTSCLIERVEIAKTRGKIDEGMFAAERAIQASITYRLLPKHIQSLELYYDLLKFKGNLALALVTLEQKETLEDSLFRVKSIARIEELESVYQKKQDQQRILQLETEGKLAEQELSRRRYFQYLLLISLLSLGVIAYLLFRQFRIRSEAKYQLLAFQINDYQNKVAKLLGKSSGPMDVGFEELNAPLLHPISEKEYEVLGKIMEDKSNQQIAEELAISVNTVKFHLKNIYEKLEVKNRREVVEKIFSRTI